MPSKQEPLRERIVTNYAKKVIDFLNEEKINYVPKYRNPTNVPQCRAIEDFFADLTQIVYANG